VGEILGPHHCLQIYLHHSSLGLRQFLLFWRGEVVSVGETVKRVRCWYYHSPTEEWISQINLLHSSKLELVERKMLKYSPLSGWREVKSGNQKDIGVHTC